MWVFTPWQGGSGQLFAWDPTYKVVEISPPPQEMVEVSPPPLGSAVLPLHHYKSKKQLVKTQLTLHYIFKISNATSLPYLHITNLLIDIGFLALQ